MLEGDAGFYHAYAGNNQGRLTYSFVGDTQTSLDKITAGLGKEWMFLETLYRIYSTAGYNIAHIDVTAGCARSTTSATTDVDRVEAVVNWIETQYPEPRLPESRERIVEPAGGQHRVLRGLRRRRARLPLAARLAEPRRPPIRPRCWSS